MPTDLHLGNGGTLVIVSVGRGDIKLSVCNGKCTGKIFRNGKHKFSANIWIPEFLPIAECQNLHYNSLNLNSLWGCYK